MFYVPSDWRFKGTFVKGIALLRRDKQMREKDRSFAYLFRGITENDSPDESDIYGEYKKIGV